MIENNIEYYDISPELSESIAVWPGDVEFKHLVTIDFKTGGNILLSSINTSTHLGAHTDAPNHYNPNGEGIDKRDLTFYLGDCQVITIKKARSSRILLEDLTGVKVEAKRILFKTLSYPNPSSWSSDFVSLSPELIHSIAKRGVILVGIDTPSIDPCDDRSLLSHQAVYENNMAILEGIVLNNVPDGCYSLISLPLKIKNADASPVRAILIKKC